MVKVGGLLSDCRRITTRRGAMMLVGTIEDLSGNIGLVVFPKTYEGCEALLNNDEVVVVRGRINRDMRTDEFNIVAETILPMEELEKVRSLHIELVGIKDKQVLSRMRDILMFFKGQDPAFIRMDGQRVALGKEFHVDINPELVSQLEELLGGGAVKVEFRAVKKENEPQGVNF